MIHMTGLLGGHFDQSKRMKVSDETSVLREMFCGFVQTESNVLSALVTRWKSVALDTGYFVSLSVLGIVDYGIQARFRYDLPRFEHVAS
jgi:hypothetical protein